MGMLRAMFLGDFGNWMDSDDNAHKIRQLKAHATSKSRLDRTQNQRLAALEGDNADLKVCLSAMAHLLVSKGVLSKSEVASVVGPIDEETEGSA